MRMRIFNRKFFYDTPNHLAEFLPDDQNLPGSLRLIRFADFRPDSRLTLVMDDEQGQSAAFMEQK